MSVSSASLRVPVGGAGVVDVVATNVTACTETTLGSLSASGGTTAVSGSFTFRPAAGGVRDYTITCSGANGSVSRQVTVVSPMPVYRTSYENKNAIPFDATQVPSLRALGIPRTVPTEQDSIDRSIAFGDFFQEGRYAAFVMASNSSGRYGPDRPGDIPGIGYFLAQDASGRWVDRSSVLFRRVEDRSGCISPSYAAVADFNNDGRPDVYVACTGPDFEIPGYTPEQNMAAGRTWQVIYLSQPDGSYASRKVEEETPLYGHKAVALDIDGDGNADVITTDVSNPNQPLGCGAPYVLKGRGDGSFVRDESLIDQQGLRTLLSACGMFNVDIVPVDGRHDLLVGGLALGPGGWLEPSIHSVVWVKGRTVGGAHRFDFANAVRVAMPAHPANGSATQFPLDIVYNAGTAAFYMKTTDTLAITGGVPGANWAVVRLDRDTAQTSVIDTWFNPTSAMRATSPQFKPSHGRPGHLQAYSGGCEADTTGGDCGRLVPMR